jgi:hypothetical protein
VALTLLRTDQEHKAKRAVYGRSGLLTKLLLTTFIVPIPAQSGQVSLTLSGSDSSTFSLPRKFNLKLDPKAANKRRDWARY